MSEKRSKMKPLVVVSTEGDAQQYRCAYEFQWPPGHARVGDNFGYLRATSLITEAEYQRLQVWERVCGLLKMDPDKCLTCPHIRLETNKGLVEVVGEAGVPIVGPPCSRRLKAIRSRKP